MNRSYSHSFVTALNDNDKEFINNTIYPYYVNGFHYFAHSDDIDGIRYCFENNISFIKDLFGNTPLDYAS